MLDVESCHHGGASVPDELGQLAAVVELLAAQLGSVVVELAVQVASVVALLAAQLGSAVVALATHAIYQLSDVRLGRLPRGMLTPR